MPRQTRQRKGRARRTKRNQRNQRNQRGGAVTDFMKRFAKDIPSATAEEKEVVEPVWALLSAYQYVEAKPTKSMLGIVPATMNREQAVAELGNGDALFNAVAPHMYLNEKKSVKCGDETVYYFVRKAEIPDTAYLAYRKYVADKAAAEEKTAAANAAAVKAASVLAAAQDAEKAICAALGRAGGRNNNVDNPFAQ